MDPVKHVRRMYATGDGHVAVLAASIRNLDQLLCCFFLETELVTAPTKLLEEWAQQGCSLPDSSFEYKAPGKPIQYQTLDLDQPWRNLEIQHELTRKGLEKFAADYRATLSQTEQPS